MLYPPAEDIRNHRQQPRLIIEQIEAQNQTKGDEYLEDGLKVVGQTLKKKTYKSISC